MRIDTLNLVLKMGKYKDAPQDRKNTHIIAKSIHRSSQNLKD